MKKTICVILFGLIFTLFSHLLFPLIEGRIEGIVKDKDTGNIISGAQVELFQWFSIRGNYTSELRGTTSTDEKGFFSLNVSRPCQYYLRINKEGYIPFLPNYYYGNLKEELFEKRAKIFRLEEGQIKFIQFDLEKGGAISGTLQGRSESGIVSVNSEILLYKMSLDENFFEKEFFYYIDKSRLKNGKFLFDGLEPAEDYTLIIYFGNGYPRKVFEKISIKKGVVYNFDQIFDLTDITGIHGTITINGIPPLNGIITMEKEEDNIFSNICRYSLNEKDGNYSCKGLSPGKYLLEVSVQGQDGIQLEKTVTIEIKQEVNILLDFPFETGDL